MLFLADSTCSVLISISTCPWLTMSPALTFTAVTSPPALAYTYTTSAASTVPVRLEVTETSPVVGFAAFTTVTVDSCIIPPGPPMPPGPP